MCRPDDASNAEQNDSCWGASWLPGMAKTSIPASQNPEKSDSHVSSASREGTGLSKTSPAMRTPATFSSRAIVTSCAMTFACSSIIDMPLTRLPM